MYCFESIAPFVFAIILFRKSDLSFSKCGFLKGGLCCSTGNTVKVIMKSSHLADTFPEKLRSGRVQEIGAQIIIAMLELYY